jgi:ABC-type nitrate/sulfonate/bicarbonate transport system permease component
MRLNLKSLALAAGILWGLALFLTGVSNLIWPGYGEVFLKMMASVYPGYHAARSIGDLIVGTLYAVIDGAIGGLLFGWVYNLFVGRGGSSRESPA